MKRYVLKIWQRIICRLFKWSFPPADMRKFGFLDWQGLSVGCSISLQHRKLYLNVNWLTVCYLWVDKHLALHENSFHPFLLAKLKIKFVIASNCLQKMTSPWHNPLRFSWFSVSPTFIKTLGLTFWTRCNGGESLSTRIMSQRLIATPWPRITC